MAISVPGSQFVGPNQGTIDPDEYEQHFNATETAEAWSQNPFSGIPVVGDIFAGFNLFYQNIGYLFDGFPVLLTYIKDVYIVNPEGQLVFDVIANVLRAVYALLIVMLIVEFISGRYPTD